MRTYSLLPGVLAGILAGAGATRAEAQLSVTSTGTGIVVESDRTPTWKMTFTREGRFKGAAIDLRIPADHSTNLFTGYRRVPQFGFGASIGYWEDGSFKWWPSNWTHTLSRFEIVQESPDRVVVAVVGKAADRYAFRQHYVVVPSGIRHDLEIVNGSTPGVMTDVRIWLGAGCVTEKDRGKIWDPKTRPLTPPPYGVDQLVSLPGKINYPFTQKFPYLLAPGVRIWARALEVPPVVAKNRQWRFPTRFGTRFNWTQLGIGANGGDPAKGKPREIIPPDDVLRYSYTFQVAPLRKTPPLISPHDPILPDAPR